MRHARRVLGGGCCVLRAACRAGRVKWAAVGGYIRYFRVTAGSPGGPGRCRTAVRSDLYIALGDGALPHHALSLSLLSYPQSHAQQQTQCPTEFPRPSSSTPAPPSPPSASAPGSRSPERSPPRECPHALTLFAFPRVCLPRDPGAPSRAPRRPFSDLRGAGLCAHATVSCPARIAPPRVSERPATTCGLRTWPGVAGACRRIMIVFGPRLTSKCLARSQDGLPVDRRGAGVR